MNRRRLRMSFRSNCNIIATFVNGSLRYLRYYNPSIILRNGIAAIGRKGITGVGDCKQPIGGSLSTPIHEEKEKKGEEKNRNGSRSHSYGDSVIHASVSLIRELDVEGN